MLWRELVQSICTDCRYELPAEQSELFDVEAALSVQIPVELYELWQEANGIADRYGNGVWPTREVVEQNLEMRGHPEQNDLYMTFETMLCFADAGDGDLFFFPIQADGKINRPDIFVWEHETDSRRWVAANLKGFVESWFSGKGFNLSL